MINISPIRDMFLSESNTTLNKSFKKLNINDSIKFIISGLHPSCLPQKWYVKISKTIPDKLYLFKPKHVLFIDLVSILSKKKNIKNYENHISFYKNEMLQKCNRELITKCIQFMTITDDDIRCLKSRFDNDAIDDMLPLINGKSVLNINYIFSDKVTEKMFAKNHKIYNHLYYHQNYSFNFLTDMMHKYGIAPINTGILENISIDNVIEILSVMKNPQDTISFLDMVPKKCLLNEKLKLYVIKRIKMGYVDNYIPYAKEFLVSYVDELGFYSSIFFNTTAKLEDIKDLNKGQLLILCKYIKNFEIHINYIIDYLIKNNYMDVLSYIIDKIPKEVFTEEICVRIVCDSKKKVQIKSLPIHSSLVMVACIQMKYDDVVDLLDSIDINVLKKKVNILTDYVFKTNWFNDNHELISLFVKKYGFCSSKMKQLMFDYPLTTEASKHLLDIMIKESNMVYSKHNAISLMYLLCTNNELKYKKTKCSCLELINSVELYTDLKNDLTEITNENDVVDQFFEISMLASYGVFFIPNRYLPFWLPALDIVNGNENPFPTKIEHCVIFKLSYDDFVSYQDIGYQTSKLYFIDEISNFHAAINSLMGTLLVYMVVGSKFSNKSTFEYVRLLINTFFTGMKINDVLSEDLTDVCVEINNLRPHVCDSDFVFVKKNSLYETINLCKKICVTVILGNN
ncbi:33L [Yaba monkey tumor virus]|uniref:33L n=1 Tax=Yaba monkey tumor virus (strain VR587) TaxID=928314 RepID=Q6TUX9_YMTV5|nr:hypothetical protein YMTVg33L [Yaba monkey tumor virus]AAR07390.1 33L [Yaba monkey tumor virus]